MSGVIQTGNHPKLLWPGIQALFGMVYDRYPSEYPKIFEVQPTSNKNYEENQQLNGFGMMPQKPEGQGLSYQGQSQGWTKRYVHVAYALGYIVTKEELDDDQYEQVSRQRAEALAFSANVTQETVGANVLNRAYTSGYNGGDGVVLASASHPDSIGGTYSNITTAASFSEAALEDLAIAVMNAKDFMGLPMKLLVKRLIVPTSLIFEAQRVLESTLRSSSADNDLNALRSLGVVPEVQVNHYLTSTTQYQLITNCPNGLKWFPRVALEFDQDNDFDTKNAKAAAYMRFSCGWSDPHSTYLNAGL